MAEAAAGTGSQIMDGLLKDPKYSAERWKKMQHTHKSGSKDTITIHYWEEKFTQVRELIKFKNN